MPDYTVSEIPFSDTRGNQQMDALLRREGIRRDRNLEYSCGIFDENINLIATGSFFQNTLRCLAVSSLHQGEGLMNQIVSHLVSIQAERGNTHLFLYTKWDSAKFFSDLGFYEIVGVNKKIVFMENRRTGFLNYLKKLQKETDESPVMKKYAASSASKPLRIASIVMNANPFTLGHQYLTEQACCQNDIVHLFMVSENSSLIPFSIRKRLIMEGTAHPSNIIYHDSGPYMISNATFPSYFQKDSHAVMESHAFLDLSVFSKIAHALSIQNRYAGEESHSEVTSIYNQIMKDRLPEYGIQCTVLPRKKIDNEIVSASFVRQAIKDNNQSLLEKFLPDTTLAFFKSPEAAQVIRQISACKNVLQH